MQCLEDVTAVCILESFENQQSLLMADRVLKELGRTKAKDNYKVRVCPYVEGPHGAWKKTENGGKLPVCQG